MRTKIFFFAMLASITTSATVTITPLGVDYATKKVTFSVSWTNSPAAPYNNRVWVWLDFCPVNGVTPATSFSTATISNPQKTGGNGTITNITTRGFFIEYSATNAGTTVTVTLSNAPAGQFNWCVYGSDYPPNVKLENGTYTFNGTTDFIVSSHAQPITTKTIAKANLTVNSSSTFTDATGCPGIGSLYCPYTGSDLYMDATHLCQQRTSGAKNWEAYIKDTRDSKLYRIVYMPDNKWWLAQNLDYRSGNYKCGINQTAYCDKYGIMLHLTDVIPTNICPNGWTLPTMSQMQAIASTEAQVRQLRSTTTWLGSSTSYGSPGTDYYGFTILATGYVDGENQSCYDSEGYASYLILYPSNNTAGVNKSRMLSGYRAKTNCFSNTWSWGWSSIVEADNDWGYLRCLR